jgi:hypothetical protein
MFTPVRLTAEAAQRMPELAGRIGKVHGIGEDWAMIAWPGVTSWHKTIDIEEA